MANSVKVQVFRSNGYEAWREDCNVPTLPYSVLNCQYMESQGEKWLVPIVVDGRVTGYEETYEDASVNYPDAFKVVRLQQIISGEVFYIMGTEEAWLSKCNECCGDTPVMDPVDIPAPNLDEETCCITTLTESECSYSYFASAGALPPGQNFNFSFKEGVAPLVIIGGLDSIESVVEEANANFGEFGIFEAYGTNGIKFTSTRSDLQISMGLEEAPPPGPIATFKRGGVAFDGVNTGTGHKSVDDAANGYVETNSTVQLASGETLADVRLFVPKTGLADAVDMDTAEAFLQEYILPAGLEIYSVNASNPGFWVVFTHMTLLADTTFDLLQLKTFSFFRADAPFDGVDDGQIVNIVSGVNAITDGKKLRVPAGTPVTRVTFKLPIPPDASWDNYETDQRADIILTYKFPGFITVISGLVIEPDELFYTVVADIDTSGISAEMHLEYIMPLKLIGGASSYSVNHIKGSISRDNGATWEAAFAPVSGFGESGSMSQDAFVSSNAFGLFDEALFDNPLNTNPFIPLFVYTGQTFKFKFLKPSNDHAIKFGRMAKTDPDPKVPVISDDAYCGEFTMVGKHGYASEFEGAIFLDASQFNKRTGAMGFWFRAEGGDIDAPTGEGVECP